MQFYNLAQAQQALKRLPLERDLAVIICGVNYTPEQEREHQQTWSCILAELGFRRVVFVRARETTRLNGSLILQDVQLPIRPRPAA